MPTVTRRSTPLRFSIRHSFPRPDIALTGGVGVEWRGSRLGFSALYTLERYDFPVGVATRRPEELSALEVRVVVQLRQTRGP